MIIITIKYSTLFIHLQKFLQKTFKIRKYIAFYLNGFLTYL